MCARGSPPSCGAIRGWRVVLRQDSLWNPGRRWRRPRRRRSLKQQRRRRRLGGAILPRPACGRHSHGDYAMTHRRRRKSRGPRGCTTRDRQSAGPSRPRGPWSFQAHQRGVGFEPLPPTTVLFRQGADALGKGSRPYDTLRPVLSVGLPGPSVATLTPLRPLWSPAAPGRSRSYRRSEASAAAAVSCRQMPPGPC